MEEHDVILLNKIRAGRGDSQATTILGMGYAAGLGGMEKNPELGLKYLKDAADLCHPEALHIMVNLYKNGGKYGCVAVEEDLDELIRYLRLTCGSRSVVDYSSFNEGKFAKKYLGYWWQAYATLGRLYVTIPELDEQELGAAMSIRGAEEGHMTESYYAAGLFYRSIGKKNRSIHYFGKGAFENNDNSYWAKESKHMYEIALRE